jgi:hypothetical protein
MGVFAEANAAHRELPKEATRAPARLAAIVAAHFEFRCALLFDD